MVPLAKSVVSCRVVSYCALVVECRVVSRQALHRSIGGKIFTVDDKDRLFLARSQGRNSEDRWCELCRQRGLWG